MDAIKAYRLKSGNILRVFQDEDPLDPRKEYDNLGTMVCFHRRYNLGDKPEKHGYRFEDYGSWGELAAAIQKKEEAVIILPLFLYDHSGITMSVGGDRYPFNDHWDAGQVGFIFLSRKAALDNWSVKRMSPRLKKMAEEILRGEVKTYDQYLTGDVYGFRVIKPVECESCGHTEDEVVDSCWGFFGDDPKENGMLDNFGDEIVEEIEE